MVDIAAIADHRLKRDGLPIIAVSIGVENDRATWLATLDNGSPQQIARASSLLLSFNIDAERVRVKNSQTDTQLSDDVTIKFIVQLVTFASNSKTPAQIRTEASRLMRLL